VGPSPPHPTPDYVRGFAKIKARNYNLDIKNPHIGEQINHDPEVLLQKYAQQQQYISKLREQLKDILAAALNGRGQA
jgi:type I restriction enzyme M protein